MAAVSPEGLVRRFAFVLLSALVATAAVAVPSVLAAPPTRPAEPAAVPGQLLVGYVEGARASQRTDARGRASAKLLERVVAARSDRTEVELVRLPDGANRDAAIRRLEDHPAVAYAEPNWIVTTAATSDDPAYTGGSLWGMYGDTTSPENAYGSQAGEAWAAGSTGSSSVAVGVIDTGVDISHPDLAGNVWTNPGEVAGNGVDDDGNGYVDDVHGWDFHNGDRTVYDPGDGDKHGTHVAGTIAGVGANGTGVAGVAWSADVITAKFLGPKGGYTSNAIKAIDYLTDLKTRHGLDLVATNNSWGGGSYSSSLHSAIERAGTAGILFMAAAGNGGSDGTGDDNDVTPHYPSSYDNANIVAVASIAQDGSRSTFSNYGSGSVDLGAPGSGIYSTLPGGTYGTYSGTSMATPHVTGAAVLAAATGMSGDEDIKAAILGSTVPTSSLTKTVTGGRLDVSGFVPKSSTTASVADDSHRMSEDTSLTVAAPGVLGNDTGASAPVVVTAPANGSVTMASDGSFGYVPAGDFSGTDSFTYQAVDAAGVVVGPATVTITVDPVDDAPVASADSYSATSGAQLAVAAPGVLGGDTDVDGDALTASLVSGPSAGVLSLAANGSFTYTSNAGFTGTDSFTYRASDGALSSDATVTITVGEAVVVTSTSAATIEWSYFGGKANKNHLDIWVRVEDSAGKPVAGAAVTATINGSTKKATTDSHGVAMLATYRSVGSGCFDVAVVSVTATPTWDGIGDADKICKT